MSPFVRIPVFVVLALAVSIGAVEAARTYKWVDEDGVTHYSQHPPPDGEAEIINPSIGLPSDAGTGSGESGTAGTDADGDGSDDGPETMEAFCNQLREQEQMLAGERDVRVRREDGSLEPLEGDARAARRAEIQQQLDQHCS